MADTNNFVNDGFRIATNISLMGREMGVLSRAFAMVGNEKVSDQLYHISLECEKYDAEIRKLIGNETSRALKEAQEMMGTILVCSLAKAESEKKDVVFVG